jgi:hypothetical protein
MITSTNSHNGLFDFLVAGFLSAGEELFQIEREAGVVNLERPAEVLLVLRVEDVVQKLVELLDLPREPSGGITPGNDHLFGEHLNAGVVMSFAESRGRLAWHRPID